jgi:PQQ-like domain
MRNGLEDQRMFQWRGILLVFAIVIVSGMSFQNLPALATSAQPSATKGLRPVLLVTLPNTVLAVKNDIVFYRQGSVMHAFDTKRTRELWRKAVPGLVAAWNNSVYITNADGRVSALDARSGRVQWTVQSLKQPSGFAAVANVLLINGENAVGEFKMQALEIGSGKPRWIADSSRGSINVYGTIGDRFYRIIGHSSESKSIVPSSGLIDSLNGSSVGQHGDYIDGAAMFFQTTYEGNRFVEVEQNIAQGITDTNPELYDVTLKLFDASKGFDSIQVPTLVQDLGKFRVGPRLQCRSAEPLEGLILPRFAGANAQNIWLDAFDSCGWFVAQVPVGGSGMVEYFSQPLSSEMRMLIYNEGIVLAKQRSGSGLVWSTQVGNSIYALRDTGHLEIWDAQTGRLRSEAKLVLDLKLLQPSGRLGVSGSIDTNVQFYDQTLTITRGVGNQSMTAVFHL